MMVLQFVSMWMCVHVWYVRMYVCVHVGRCADGVHQWACVYVLKAKLCAVYLQIARV